MASPASSPPRPVPQVIVGDAETPEEPAAVAAAAEHPPAEPPADHRSFSARMKGFLGGSRRKSRSEDGGPGGRPPPHAEPPDPAARRRSVDEKEPGAMSRLRNAFRRSSTVHEEPPRIATIEEYPDLPLRMDPAPEADPGALLTPDVAAALRAKMPSRFRYNNHWVLLYRLSSNGASLNTLYGLVSKKGPTVWVVRGMAGQKVGAFVASPVRNPGWSGRDSEHYYGSGEGFVFEVVRGTGEVRVAETTMRNSHYVATLPDAVIFGGSGGDPYAAVQPGTKAGEGIALQLGDEFRRAWSEGQCPTYELKGIPLGAERDAAGNPVGVLDYGDRGLAYQFSVADVEIWGLRFGREAGISPLYNLDDGERLYGEGLGR
ncbi:TLD-domain-containing protein [Hyaloraphidium curvatum]|nr:TLD-domain-containing protein [Hyaloraphidium curvatum]